MSKRNGTNVTGSPSEDEVSGAVVAKDSFAAEFAAAVDAVGYRDTGGTPTVEVIPENWVRSVAAARDSLDLPFLSWISAIDWARHVEVGESVSDSESVEEHFEVICRLSSIKNGDALHIVTKLAKEGPEIATLTGEFGGAEWHEREMAEMFGISYIDAPRLSRHLYLPDSFEGYPLLKSFPLLSRQVKPWPGVVDVEDMPSTENVEAAAKEVGQE